MQILHRFLAGPLILGLALFLTLFSVSGLIFQLSVFGGRCLGYFCWGLLLSYPSHGLLSPIGNSHAYLELAQLIQVQQQIDPNSDHISLPLSLMTLEEFCLVLWIFLFESQMQILSFINFHRWESYISSCTPQNYREHKVMISKQLPWSFYTLS